VYDWRRSGRRSAGACWSSCKVDPDLVYPRQTAEPVLYVGGQTAMRLNVGYPSGRVIALVPGDARSIPTAPWRGSGPAPAEAVTQETVEAERARAIEAGIAPITRGQIAVALGRGGAPLSRSTLNALLADAATLVMRYAPDEAERATALRSQGE
jgi:hypothetical protein